MTTDVSNYNELYKDVTTARLSNKVSPFFNGFRVTCKYGTKNPNTWRIGWHTGIDLVASTDNWDVRSVMNGVVQDVNCHGKAYGNNVMISNEDGTLAFYCHLKTRYVNKGAVVKKGQVIGVMGNTGTSGAQVNSTKGAHLHLEYHPSGKYVYAKTCADPAPWLGLQAGYQKGEVVKADAVNNAAYSNYDTVSDADQNQTKTGFSQEDALNILLRTGNNYKLTGEYEYGGYQYGRRYRVIVIDSKGRALEMSNLRCTFEINKTYFMQPNLSNVKIYNLNANTERSIIKQGQKLVVEAGYEGTNYGKIFEGNILQPRRYKENATDYVLELSALDGDRFIMYSFINQTLLANQTLRDVAETVANNGSVPIDLGSISDTFSANKLPRAKALFGMGRDYMRQIANTTQTAFSVQDGKATFNNLQNDAKIVELNPETGMIGGATQTDKGISLKCLLNPQLNIGSAIHIDNSLVQTSEISVSSSGMNVIRMLDDDGIYKVYNIKHSGDTRGNDWYTEIEAVAQAGLVPAIAENANSNIN